MRAKKQDYFPFRPVSDSVHLTKDDTEENNLAAEPEHLHDHPKNEIRFEAQLANERVAQHDPPNLKIAAHAADVLWRSAQLVNWRIARSVARCFLTRHCRNCFAVERWSARSTTSQIVRTLQ